MLRSMFLVDFYAQTAAQEILNITSLRKILSLIWHSFKAVAFRVKWIKSSIQKFLALKRVTFLNLNFRLGSFIFYGFKWRSSNCNMETGVCNNFYWCWRSHAQCFKVAQSELSHGTFSEPSLWKNSCSESSRNPSRRTSRRLCFEMWRDAFLWSFDSESSKSSYRLLWKVWSDLTHFQCK